MLTITLGGMGGPFPRRSSISFRRRLLMARCQVLSGHGRWQEIAALEIFIATISCILAYSAIY
jgi:hypothetical protein